MTLFLYKNNKIKTKSDIIDALTKLTTAQHAIASLVMTGQIKTRQELQTFIQSCPLSTGKTTEEQLIKWGNFLKTQPQQTLTIEATKNILKYKGNDAKITPILNLTCKKIQKTKKLGRPKKNPADKLRGRPLHVYQTSIEKILRAEKGLQPFL